MTSMYEVDGEEMKQRLQSKPADNKQKFPKLDVCVDDYYQQQAQAQQNGQKPLDGAGAGQQPVNYAALTTPELATMLQVSLGVYNHTPHCFSKR